MRVRYTPRASADLDAIVTYLQERSPAAAASVLQVIRARVEGLGDFPLLGRRTKRIGIRCMTISRYPYKVYYTIFDDSLSVLHIRDSRRAPWGGAK